MKRQKYQKRRGRSQSPPAPKNAVLKRQAFYFSRFSRNRLKVRSIFFRANSFSGLSGVCWISSRTSSQSSIWFLISAYHCSFVIPISSILTSPFCISDLSGLSDDIIIVFL